MDVESDGENLVISDSEDEGPKKGKKKAVTTKEEVKEDGGKEEDGDEEKMDTETNKEEEEPKTLKFSTLAQTKILTPADFALLNDLRIKAATEAVAAGGGTATKRKLAQLEAQKKSSHSQSALGESFVSESDILGPRKKAKMDYEERMASIQKGREGREKFGSAKGKKKKDMPSSTTNREKKRNKPIMMILASGAVRGKKKASLREKQRKLRAHVDKAKKGGH